MQTELALPEPTPPGAAFSPPAESSSSANEPAEALIPTHQTGNPAQESEPAGDSVEAKVVNDAQKPKKRAPRGTKKTETAPGGVTPVATTAEAAGANTADAEPPTPPRKRATRKKKAVEPQSTQPPAGVSHTGAAPTDLLEEPGHAPQAAEGSTEEIRSGEKRCAGEPEGGGQPASARESASPQEEDSWEGKRGRRFRNRRRGRERFQRREDFQGNGGGGSPGASTGENQPAVDAQPVFEEGLVDVSGKGFGFLRKADVNYDPRHTDTFITPEVIRAHNLRDSMWIKGQIRQGHRGPQLFKLLEIEGEDPEPYKNLPVFDELTVLNPLERIRLETKPDRFTTRVVDLMAPIGKGTRGLLVAPPRTGKTTILQHIAEALAINHPAIKVILLLVDERPEEVTELRRALPHAEVIASSNDSDIKSHTRIAQLGIDRAKRLVEMGKDVFVLMDSITRIGRAFNNAQSGKGRTMSGGVDSRALEIPRRLFAAARNTEEAGSLTIIGTALVETGSKMDELIFLEFKGTGNMELVLDRKISDQRVYPAADIFMSGTRREELLIPADSLHKINIIRRGLAGHKPLEAMERLLFFLRRYPTNEEMLAGIPG